MCPSTWGAEWHFVNNANNEDANGHPRIRRYHRERNVNDGMTPAQALQGMVHHQCNGRRQEEELGMVMAAQHPLGAEIQKMVGAATIDAHPEAALSTKP
jgi:hypothetical protein